MSTIKFNINEKVKVQLTEAGREHHRKKYEALLGGIMLSKYPYQSPPEDSDGWSEWQLWDLMGIFGEKMGLGFPLMFGTEIQLLKE